jgi:hypothetical protein
MRVRAFENRLSWRGGNQKSTLELISMDWSPALVGICGRTLCLLNVAFLGYEFFLATLKREIPVVLWSSFHAADVFFRTCF